MSGPETCIAHGERGLALIASAVGSAGSKEKLRKITLSPLGRGDTLRQAD